MHALAVSAQKEDLVEHVGCAVAVQAVDLVSEPLPLRALPLGVEVRVCVVGPVDKAEVGRGLVELSMVSMDVG